MDRKVHISYKWIEPGTGIVRNWLFPALTRNDFFGVLDVKDCCYMKSIRQFEQEIGQADLVIIVVNKDYMDSDDCLYEATSIINNGNYINRVALINMDGTYLSTTAYVEKMQYYQACLTQEMEKKKVVIQYATTPLDVKIEKYETILNGLGQFWNMVSDNNTLNFTALSKDDFAIVIAKIKELYEKSMIDESMLVEVDTLPCR